MEAKLHYSYVYEGPKLELTNGSCATYPDPDIWFAQESEELDGVRPTEYDKEVLVAKSTLALKICSTCPVKASCLAEGMKDDNLDWGIWGGTLPAERLKLANKPTRGHFRYNKVLFATKIRTRERLRREYGI
jgi:hypothetical protein